MKEEEGEEKSEAVFVVCKCRCKCKQNGAQSCVCLPRNKLIPLLVGLSVCMCLCLCLCSMLNAQVLFSVSRCYLGSDTPAAMTWTAMTMRVSSRVTVSNSSHPEGSKMLSAYGPMMIPKAVDTTSHEDMKRRSG